MILPPTIYDLGLPPAPSPVATPGDVSPTPASEAPIQFHEKCINRGALWVSLRVLGKKNDGLSIGGQTFFRARLIKQHYHLKLANFSDFMRRPTT